MTSNNLFGEKTETTLIPAYDYFAAKWKKPRNEAKMIVLSIAYDIKCEVSEIDRDNVVNYIHGLTGKSPPFTKP